MKKPSLTDQLSKGIEQLSGSRHKRNDRICPRCGKPSVDRDNRRCAACGGRLLFPGDTGNDVFGQPIMNGQGAADWFMWHRSIFGFTGWYHRSYFDNKPISDIQPSGYL
jgi:ribosomal protein L37E